MSPSLDNYVPQLGTWGPQSSSKEEEKWKVEHSGRLQTQRFQMVHGKTGGWKAAFSAPSKEMWGSKAVVPYLLKATVLRRHQNLAALQGTGADMGNQPSYFLQRLRPTASSGRRHQRTLGFFLLRQAELRWAADFSGVLVTIHGPLHKMSFWNLFPSEE